VGVALLGLVLSALICHFLFYLVPGMLGMRTGLPLYIVGTSTFGAQGGFIMPGFLMGVLQFGWLGVNVFFSSQAVGAFFGLEAASTGVKAVMIVWGILAAFVGLKGIQYVARVSTYLPLIPLVILILMLVNTMGGVASFDPQKTIAAHQVLAPTAPAALGTLGAIALILTYVVGFFATAGAAGVDIAMSGRDSKDVSMGGLFGIALAILVTAGISMLIVAGVYGSTELSAKAVAAGTEKQSFILDSFNLIPVVMSSGAAKWMMFLLAVAAFPPACFSSFIAANSFRTTLPKVNPFISVGIGAAVSIILAVTGLAGKVIPVFVIIGASFGPICGAMMVDYLINGRKWSGPRAGFNPAGWIAWALGFVVGILPNLGVNVPAAPVAAFVVGAVVFFLCTKMGMQSKIVPISGALAEATK
jgi:cytosine permease